MPRNASTTPASASFNIKGKSGHPRFVSRMLALLFTVGLTTATARAQNIQFTQGNVNPGFDNTLQIPLRAYPDRGATSLPVTLYYSSEVWRVGHLSTVNSGGFSEAIAEAVYAEYSSAGWQTSLDLPKIEWPKQSDGWFYSGGPYNFASYPSGSAFRVRRVYIHMPDGSKHELREGDQPYQGAIDMYGIFYAVDGSRLRYDSTGQNTGTLYLPDGTRYVLNGSTAQFIDRNGNTLNYNASTRQWTDAMGRSIGLPLPANPQPQLYTYTLPGLDGPITYKFRWQRLSETGVLTPDSNNQVPARKPIANNYLPYPNQPPTNSSGGNYPLYVQPAYSTRPSLFITDGSDEGETATVVGRSPDGGQNGGELFNPVVLTEIILPNDLHYTFSYNIYGEINKIVYPSGGYERYEYGEMPDTQVISPPYTQGERIVTKREISAGGGGNDLAVWQYSIAGVYQDSSVPAGSLRLTTTAPDMTRTEVYKYNLRPPVHGVNHRPFWSFGYEDARQGLIYEERLYAPNPDGSKGPLLRRKLTEWEWTANPVPPRIGIAGDVTETAYRNPRPKKEVSIVLDTGGAALAKTMTFFYDTTYQLTTGIDMTVSTESHFADVDQGTAQTGAINSMPYEPPAVTVLTTYVDNYLYPEYRNKNLLGLVTSRVLQDAGGQPVSKTVNGYDETALQTYTDIGSEWTDPGPARGNVTTVRRYIDASADVALNQQCPAGVCLDTHQEFDQVGNVWKMKNERGIESVVAYDAFYKHAYATQTTTSVPDPSGAQGSAASFTSTTVYDYNTGLTLSSTDLSGQTTYFSYKNEQNVTDPLNRLRKVTQPDGGWTKYEFNDAAGNLYMLTETRQDVTNTTKAYQFFDAMGRPSRSLALEEGNVYLASDTQYDQMGRAWRTSNPYRTQGLNGAVNPSGFWTTTAYDALGRPTIVTLTDGTIVQTSYQGAYTTFTDQAGKKRRQKTDALGRIVRVDEPDASGQLGSVEEPLRATYYEYNALGSVVHVQQGTGTDLQHRYFKFDALSRLTHERQVEQVGVFTLYDPLTANSQWTRKLVYDENGYSGLLTSQWDARNIRTQYAYDNLNRVKQLSYSDTTPTVKYFYDSVRFTVAGEQRPIHNPGRLAEVQTLASGDAPATAQKYNYDLMGRIINSRQTVDANSYTMSYSYNFGGALTSETYPSGRVVSLNYDAAARLASVTSGAQTYASQFTYGAQGLLTAVSLGNGTIESYDYNARMQLKTLSLTKDSVTLQRYEYKYGRVNADGSVDETQNNGQLGRIEGFIGAAKQWQQRFAYDSMGRLSTASEYRADNNQRSYLINYDYDSFGNRYQFAANNPGSTNPLPFVAVEDGHINKLTNRFTSGMAYDDAGTVTADQKFRGMQYQYDANNRQRWSAHTDGSAAVTAVYDGTGQRVAIKVNGIINNVMVYDAMNKLVAEYSTNAGTGSGGVQYVFADKQGSTRLVTRGSGEVVSRQDYQPFGEELGAVGMRSADLFYGGAISARQKYAGMEKDEASGMSHTLWRKYDGMSGRWTSPDPYGGSMTVADPQSFNRYTYVNNDPLNLTDPTGLVYQVKAEHGWSEVSDFWYGGGEWRTRMFWNSLGGQGGKKGKEKGKKSQKKPPLKKEQQPRQQEKQKDPPTLKVMPSPVDFDVNLDLRNGKYFSGFDSVLTVTVSDKDGNPLPGVTGIESVKGIKLCGDGTLNQNPFPVTTDQNGQSFDLVSVGAFTDGRITDSALVQRIYQENATTPCTQITEQTLTLNMPDGGTFKAVFQRTFTNVDQQTGNLLPFRRSETGKRINYTISIGPVSVTPVR